MAGTPTAATAGFPYNSHRSLAVVARDERDAQRAADWFSLDIDREPTEAQHRKAMIVGSASLLSAVQDLLGSRFQIGARP